MRLVLLTALGVGGATIIGSLIGFAFKKITHKFTDIVLAFSAGVMLAAAVLGLIIPSVEYGGKYGLVVTVAGIFIGAFALNLLDKLVPHVHKLAGVELESHDINNEKLSKVPKILESPYVDREYPPYKFEIEMIKNKEFNENLYNDIINYYNK